MTRSRSLIPGCVLLYAMTLSGCFTSPPPNEFPPALSPRGAIGAVYLADGRNYWGELLSFTDSAFVVLVGGRVAVAPFRHVERLAFSGFSCGEFPSGNCLSPKSIEDARTVSRFPYGIPAPALRALLERGKQTAPDSLNPRNP
jgi:hypothetical protein